MGNSDETEVSPPLAESEAAAQGASAKEEPPASAEVTLNIVYKKQKLQVQAALDGTVETLKKQLHPLIEVPPSMQKVMIRGLARDDKTLRQLGVTSGAKVMVVGSTLNDVLSVAKPDTKVRGGRG
ncbi:ubiquitin domain-containing protein UBFD1-like [Amphibalanus amphitrite]|uniref:ubiquitin domain-containing protein UBFD1-like n=1 Tax=Amphibalanus amphitrite TaxID=1232801 RepID=UPI001C9002DC|nr:ubiquitin domain-containing protein UBFD1-like [Amphibalanus amphitrite]